jgi:integrase
MAHLIRPWVYRYLRDGKQVPKGTPGAKRKKERARKWYAAGVPGYPKSKRFPLASDRNVALTMLAALVRKAERGEAGMEDQATQAQRIPLLKHLEDFTVAMRARDVSPAQVRLVEQRIRDTFEGCSFTYLRDIDSDAVADYLHGRRCLPCNQGGLSIQTSNFYIGALSQFCRWLVRKKRLAANPMLDVPRGNVALDRRHDRRNLEPQELEWLFATVAVSTQTFRYLSPADRLWLYHTACGTGFRAAELASLTPQSFALDAKPPTVTVQAAYAKNKKTVTQPIPTALAAGLSEFLAGKPAREPVWPGTWPEKASKMLARDLAETTEAMQKADPTSPGIPYVIKGPDGPLYADFHSLRHSYITMLERSGIAPKTAQALARHSDIRLTMNRYTHADQAAMAAAADRIALPGNLVEPQTPTPEQLALGFVLARTMLNVLLGTPIVSSVAPPVAPKKETDGDTLRHEGTEVKQAAPPGRPRNRQAG